jgi:hypothetical protein
MLSAAVRRHDHSSGLGRVIRKTTKKDKADHLSLIG